MRYLYQLTVTSQISQFVSITCFSTLEHMQDITCIVHSLQDPSAIDSKASEHLLHKKRRNNKQSVILQTFAIESNYQDLSPVHAAHPVSNQ